MYLASLIAPSLGCLGVDPLWILVEVAVEQKLRRHLRHQLVCRRLGIEGELVDIVKLELRSRIIRPE